MSSSVLMSTWSRPQVLLSLLLVVNAVVWLFLSQTLTVAPDMADHWMWSRDLRWGYFEHPPMIAVLIKSFSLLGGNAELALQVGTVLASALVLWVACWLQSSIFGWRSALLLALFLLSSTYFSLFAIFAHIQPLLFFWLAGLACAWRFARSLNANWLLLFGVVAGLGALSKYVYALLYLAGFIWLLLCPRLRCAWRSWQLWCAPLLSLLVFSPNLYWNASNDWASIGFHLGRGVTNNSGSVQQLANYTIGHILLFNIVLVAPLWWFWARWGWQRWRGAASMRALVIDRDDGLDAARSDMRVLLLISALVPLLLFSAAALLGSHSDPLWNETSYLGLFMLSASLPAKLWRWRWLAAGFAANLALLGALFWHIFFGLLPVEPEDDRTLDLYAWDITGEQLDSILQVAGIEPLPKLIVAREYQLAGSLSLYLKQHPFPYTLEKLPRNQWGAKPELAAQEHQLLFCREQDCLDSRTKALQQFGWESELIGSAHTEVRGRPIRTISVYRLLIE